MSSTTRERRTMMTRTMRAFAAHRDRAFLWLGGSRREAFDALYDGLVRGGVVTLTGDVGAGKTMLAEALAARLADEGALVGRLFYPGRDADDLWTALMTALGLETDAPEHEASAARLARLVGQTETSTCVVLMIDEAQSLTAAVLREMTDLCEAAAAEPAATLGVLLVGENDLDLMLARPEVAALAARIVARRRLPALHPSEVAAYVRHRLTCAEAPIDIVTADAFTALARLSGGLPRLVDLLGARAAAGGGVIDATAVARCAREMTWLAAPGRPPRGRRRGALAAALAAGAVVAVLAGATLVAVRPSGDRAAHGAAVADVTTPTPELRPPEPAAAPAPPEAIDEPDPRAIIDWLLSRPPGPGAGGH